METTHTPGGWFMHREGFSTIYVESRIGGGMVQEVAACGPTSAGSEQQEANARLISAAPELLDALQLMLEHAKRERWAGEFIGKAIHAIDKATGAKQ